MLPVGVLWCVLWAPLGRTETAAKWEMSHLGVRAPQAETDRPFTMAAKQTDGGAPPTKETVAWRSPVGCTNEDGVSGLDAWMEWCKKEAVVFPRCYIGRLRNTGRRARRPIPAAPAATPSAWPPRD